ncbi:MAG: MraY family glycosyltransferase [Campylobacterota bacterium]|nr:MraY family glycosyltransferase [Campylobacterota bacterium]
MYIEFTTVFFVAIFFIRAVRFYAPRIGLIDIPNERSSHMVRIPRGAGIGFYLAVAVVMPFFYPSMILEYPWLFFATLLVFTIGLLDDHRDASPRTKFIVLTISTIFLSFDGFVIDNVGLFFGMDISLGWFALPFTLFAVVTFTNALNLIDGLDGLAGSVSIVILLSFFIVGYQNSDLFMIIVSGSFIASLLAFLLFNWHPASIFMGDSGSLVLGFIIALLAIRSLAYIPAVSILFIAALPIIDTMIVVIRRKRTGRAVFSADRCHLHHVLRHFFAESTPKTVIYLISMQAVYSLTGLQFAKESDGGFILLLFLLNIVVVYLSVDAMIKRQKCICGEKRV